MLGAPRDFKAGQTVTCCNNFNVVTLTKGKTYEIINYYSHSDSCEVFNDCGKKTYFKAARFKVTCKEKKEKKLTDIKSAYKVMQDASGIKVGDTVKVLRKAEISEMGWANSWIASMDCAVGKKFKVHSIRGNSGVQLSEGGIGSGKDYPFFVLEVVESCRVITIAGKDIKLSEESYQELKKQLV